jgi:hypothetical protein
MDGTHIATHDLIELVAGASHAAEREATLETPGWVQVFFTKLGRQLNNALSRHSAHM